MLKDGMSVRGTLSGAGTPHLGEHSQQLKSAATHTLLSTVDRRRVGH